MVTTPLKLADINIGSALMENWGRPTSYFQRWLQANNAQITASINGLIQVEADLAAVVADLVAQQALINGLLTAYNSLLGSLELFQSSSVGTGATYFAMTDASGYMVIAHGYNALGGSDPPALEYCRAFSYQTAYTHIQMISVDSTNLTLLFLDVTGAPIVSTGCAVVWHVGGA